MSLQLKTSTLFKKLDQAQSEGLLLPSAAENIKLWLGSEDYIEFWSKIQRTIEGEEWQELNDGFYTNIQFGTGGIRGHTGTGTNRINIRTIGEAAQGLATFLRSKFKDAAKSKIALKVVIAYDTRLTSLSLAQHTASVMAGNGFEVYLFDSFRATPELSFAVRHLKTHAGIVISASHNPPSDNGFKVYNELGGQIVPPDDEKIINEVRKVKNIKRVDFDRAVEEGLIEFIGHEIDKAYYATVLNESMGEYRSAKIIYSPIHGTGQVSLLSVLEQAGFEVKVVQEQMIPDGNFPNVAGNIPNPEVPSANQLAMDALMDNGYDLALTTDPDADRLAVIINHCGKPVMLTGNQIAVVTAEFVCEELQSQGKLPKNGFLARTMVTTPILDKIAEAYNLKIYNDLLVGFKYFGDLINQKEDKGNEKYIIGGEESFGLSKGSYCRDKDAAAAGLLVSELASKLKVRGETIIDYLDDIYKKYGYFAELLETLVFEGAQGSARKERLMVSLRDNPPKKIANIMVKATSHRIQAKDGSFIVKIELEDEANPVIFIRPSGTEPKVKFYLQSNGNVLGNLGIVKSRVNTRLGKVKDSLLAIVKSCVDSEMAL